MIWKPLLIVLLHFLAFAVIAHGQEPPVCSVATDAGGNQQINGSQLCLKLKFTNGSLDFDRSHSVFKASDLFFQRLSVAGRGPALTRSQAEEQPFDQARELLKMLSKPYRLGLSENERTLEDEGRLDPDVTARVRDLDKDWLGFRETFNAWAASGIGRMSFDEIFNEDAATSDPDGIIVPLTKADTVTASLIYEGGYDPSEGIIRFREADPINNWSDTTQVQLSLPGVTEPAKRDARLNRLQKLLEPLAGTPRCLECIKTRVNSFYNRLGLKSELIVDNKNSSPLIIKVIESARIVGISWLSLDDNDQNINKLLYSVLTDEAFRQFLKKQTLIKTAKKFDYLQEMGHPGPYVNESRLQIQQLLVNQIGYTISFAFAPNPSAPETSNYNITIQKIAEGDKQTTTAANTQNETPEAAPATANPEGVVTAHEQEKKNDTEFAPKSKATSEKQKQKDKKHYVGGGFEYRPGQGLRFFGLGQLSRLPLLPGSLDDVTAKVGGQGTNGALGSFSYFSDYVLFNQLHRRVSVQLSLSSDLDANRNLTGTLTDERRRVGVARFEFEPFRDRGGSLLRFFAEGRRATVELQQPASSLKQNLSTLEVGALYLFASTEVEYPRRIRVEPKLRMGLGPAAGEPRFKKWLSSANFHQTLPSGFEADLTARVELASRATPLFELPSLGGAEVIRGFRHDDGLGRKLWSLQSEVWVPLPIGDETSHGLKALLREQVRLAPLFDIGGLYDPTNTKSGLRQGAGLGVRFIYNPIIFKIDYAYGFGAAATGGGHGKFYFSIGSNLPF